MLNIQMEIAALMTVGPCLHVTINTAAADNGPLFPYCCMRGTAPEQKKMTRVRTEPAVFWAGTELETGPVRSLMKMDRE